MFLSVRQNEFLTVCVSLINLIMKIYFLSLTIHSTKDKNADRDGNSRQRIKKLAEKAKHCNASITFFEFVSNFNSKKKAKSNTKVKDVVKKKKINMRNSHFTTEDGSLNKRPSKGTQWFSKKAIFFYSH